MSFPRVSEKSHVSLDYATVKITGELTDKELKVAEKAEKKHGLDEPIEDKAEPEDDALNLHQSKPTKRKNKPSAKKNPVAKKKLAPKKTPAAKQPAKRPAASRIQKWLCSESIPCFAK